MALPEITWMESDGRYRVIGTDSIKGLGEVCVVETPSFDHVSMQPMEVWQRAGLAQWETDSAIQPLAVRERWVGVPESEQQRCERRARDLTEMLTGDPLGSLVTGQGRPEFINPRFDPLQVDKGIRVRRKSKDLREEKERTGKSQGGTSPRSLHEQLRKICLPGGARNLVHGAFGSSRDPGDGASGEVKAAVWSFIEDRSNRETISLTNLETLFRVAHVDDDLLTDVAPAVWSAVLGKAARANNLLRPAPERRSKATRTPERQGVWEPTRPFDSLQLDATPLDLFAVDRHGRAIKTLHLVVAVDPFCSKIRAFRLVGGHSGEFTADTVKGLLWDTYWRHYFDPFGAPTDMGRSPLLARHIGAAVIDRGAQFNAVQALGMAAGIGIHEVIAPPGRGDKKPHVESRFGWAAEVAGLLPGAKGASTRERGLHPERFPMLRVEHIAMILGLLIEGILHNTPSARLGSPESGGPMTPNEVEDEYFRNHGVLEIDPHPHRALELLDVEMRKLGDWGIRVNNRIYWDPALEGLRQRAREARAARSRYIAVYVDKRRPQAVIVRGVDGGPLLVPERNSGTVNVLDDLVDRDRFDRLGTDIGGAVMDRDVSELRDRIIALAHDLATTPETPAPRRPKAVSAASTTQTQVDDARAVVEVYRGVLGGAARETQQTEEDDV